MKNKHIIAGLTATLIALPLAAADFAAADHGTIVFEMTGLESDTGMVQCALFDKENWLGTAIDGVAAPIEDGRAVCTFENPAPGHYGVAALHDLDEDGEMDKRMGVPREPYCFSRDAKVRLGPPSFKKASFHHDGGQTREQATLK